MTTRAIVRIYDRGKELDTLYVPHDGYVKGIGKDLLETLAFKKVDSSFPVSKVSLYLFSYLGFADLIPYPAGTRDMEQEYEYHISVVDPDAPESLLQIRAFRYQHGRYEEVALGGPLTPSVT
jgi:hypothetical protein